MRLTDLSIRKLNPPASGQQKYLDDSLPGFGVRVSQGGAKSFFVMYGERRRLKTIGRYPDMKLADARKEAKRIQADLSDGALGLVPEVETISFAKARTLFLADAEKRNRPRTVKDYRRLLERHFRYQKDLAELDRRDIMRSVAALSATPSEQSHAYVAIRTMLNWCVKQGYLETSPAPPMSVKTAQRDHILSEEEMVAVYRAAEEEPFPFGPIVQLLILTGQRRGEIGALRWDWIDYTERTITFPSSFTKNRTAHTLPLGDGAYAILKSLPELNEYVFPARTKSGTSFNGWGKCKERFDARLEGVAPYRLHDLRRTFSSLHAKLGTPIHVTEKLLNHTSGTISGVAAVYNRHSYMEEMREAITDYEAHLVDIIIELE